jgi:hypothetical protein
MKGFAAESRLSLAFVLSAAFTGCMVLMTQAAPAAGSEPTNKRPGSTITRYPIKMRELRNIPSLSDQQTKSKKSQA